MCGIVGGVYRQAAAPARDTVADALTLLRHRGPDADGIFIGDGYFLGHRRLSIVDLDVRSNQPMSRYGLQISFNGEIYNYLALRRRLEALGFQFSTSSDTEVILAAYRHYGIDCLDHLEGMFAFAIWDEAEKSLVLVRDRFGEKPLYYYSDGQRLLFSSEVRPLEFLLERSSLKCDEQAIGLYFLFSYIPAPYGPYKNMRQLEPGCWMKIQVPEWRIESARYYDLRNINPAPSLSFDDAAATLRDKLTSSVKARLVASDVPVAVFLSGGIDSSIITSIAARAVGSTLSAYSISFPEDPEFDESSYARTVAARYPNIRHTVVPVTERDLVDFTQRTLAQLGEPYADASLIPTAYLCAHVEEKVVLGGDGADEIFAGYGVYAAMQASAKIPASLKRLLLMLPAWSNPHGLRIPLLRALALFREHMALDPIREYLSWRCYGSVELVQALGLSVSGLAEVQTRLEGLGSGGLRDILIKDIEFNLPNDMLKKVDLASMFHSLEVRVPYLDRGVVEFALGQPSTYHLEGGVRKKLLRAAFTQDVPPPIMGRRKQGFLLPLRRWFKKGRLREEFESLAANQTFFDSTLLRKIVESHHSGRRDYSVFLWELYVFLKWIGQGR